MKQDFILVEIMFVFPENILMYFCTKQMLSGSSLTPVHMDLYKPHSEELDRKVSLVAALISG